MTECSPIRLPWLIGLGRICLPVALLFPSVVSGQRPVRRDSAGVSLLDVRLPLRVPAIVVDRAPLGVIGGTRETPDEELTSLSGVLYVARMANGLAIADEARVLRVNDNGKVLQVIARQGEGPGEFRGVNGLCLFAGDTLVVLDRTLRRASLFDPSGKLVRTVVLPGLSRREACLSDGRIISVSGAPTTGAAMGHSAPFVLVNSRTSTTAPLGTLPVEYTGLFSRMASVVGAGARIYAADGEQLAFNVLDATGRVIQGVRTDKPSQPIPPEVVEQKLKASVPAGQSAEVAKRMRAFLTREPPPKFYQPMRRLLVTPDGLVWANETDAEGLSAGWLVFSADGGLLGRVAVPQPKGSTRQEIIAVGVGEIFVRYLDENDAPTIGIFRVHPRGASK